MLKRIFVKNISLFDTLELELEKGLIVLTGETGAGKSLLINAISLIRGNKIDPTFFLKENEEAILELTFLVKDDYLVIKRKIDKEGRSLAFLNGENISLSKLKTISEELIDINGQHQGARLLNEDTHLKIIDSHKDVKEIALDVEKKALRIKELQKLLKVKESEEKEVKKKIEELKLTIDEIKRVNPKENEDEELSVRKKILENRAKFVENLKKIIANTYEEPVSIFSLLRDTEKAFTELSELERRWEPYLKEIDAIKDVILEIKKEAEREISGLEFSEKELQNVEERLYYIDRLKRKYGPTLKDVINRLEECEKEYENLLKGDLKKEDIEKELDRLFSEFKEKAKILSDKRREIGKRLSKKVTDILKELGIEKAQFDVFFRDLKVESVEDSSEKGLEDASFYFSANCCDDLKPLSKVASGGELSRIMLAILTSSKDEESGMTYVFDEIDTGIGGKQAEKVGLYLSKLSKKSQVLCITHLPQIASFGDEHIKIEKRYEKNRAIIEPKKLNYEERVEEIGRMLAGEKITESALRHAEELLKMALKKKNS